MQYSDGTTFRGQFRPRDYLFTLDGFYPRPRVRISPEGWRELIYLNKDVMGMPSLANNTPNSGVLTLHIKEYPLADGSKQSTLT